MNIEELKLKIAVLNSEADRLIGEARFCKGRCAGDNLEEAKRLLDQANFLQGQIDREENPDEIFF